MNDNWKMDGAVVIDKPAGFTSHDVVARLRRILGTKRIGHTGTLDPFATGVLVMLVGKATRLAQFLDTDAKEYDALIEFGQRTDTGDNTGTAVAVSPLTGDQIAEKLSAEDLEIIFDGFRGEIMQTPPMFSAKKVAGKKLYELARKGIDVERKAVQVTIHLLEAVEQKGTSLRIRVACSAGTYIRTLAEDIGRAAGIEAHLAELRRIRAGKFTIADAVTLERLEATDDKAAFIVPMNKVAGHLSAFDLSAERIAKTLSGLSTRTANAEYEDGEAVRMIGADGELIAIGLFDRNENVLRPKVVLG